MPHFRLNMRNVGEVPKQLAGGIVMHNLAGGQALPSQQKRMQQIGL